MKTMRIVIDCDDAGAGLKAVLVEYLRSLGIDVADLDYLGGNARAVYPEIGHNLARKVQEGAFERGILVCGTGLGMAMIANKVEGVYAGVCHDVYSAQRLRKSNNAQVLALGARVVGPELAKTIVAAWLDAEFQGGASAPKVEQMHVLEHKSFHNEPMRKIINEPQCVVDEMLLGYVRAMADNVCNTANPRVLKYKRAPVPNKVGIVTGGGSGHKPAFIGYIGRNMVDAVAVGEIFSSPPAQMFYDAFKAAHAGQGVACLYGNYAGDNMNVKMAIAMAKADGIEVRTVVANDDVPSAPSTERDKRRGVAGEVLMWKVGGAKAAMGAGLDEVIAAAQKAIDSTRSVGIGLSPCTIPEVGHPNFEIKPGMMEVGIGHHGEPGLEIAPIQTSREMARRMTGIVLPDLPFQKGDEVVVLISGLGSTPIMELSILFHDVAAVLDSQGIAVYHCYVGNYFTSLEMAGVTLTIMKLDGELKTCIDYEADSFGLKQFQRS
jgi:dihydroxyacetone kinase-like protein